MPQLRTLLLGILVSSMYSLYATEVIVKPGLYRTTYETVTLPDDEEMGLVGINYLLRSETGFYYGLGVYGAVTGQRGGFFTGGLEVGYEQKLFKNIALDLGFFGGGGGGGAAPQGGGLMLRPHAGLLYDASSWRAGLSYSLVEFPNGDISSDQFALQLEVPFDTVLAETTDIEVLNSSLGSYTAKDSFGWFEHYFSLTFQQYYPLDGTTDTGGVQDLGNIGLVGFEYGSYFDKHWFGYLESAGAMTGGAGGYAEVLGGLGYDYALSRNLGLKAKLSLGSGGGGQVDTGGGFIYKADVAAYYRPVDALTVNLEAGYMDAPDGHFSAQTAKVSLAYNLTLFGVGNGSSGSADGETDIGRWLIRLVNQSYLPSNTIRYNAEESAVELVGLKIDRYFSENFYLTGQAYGAYSGGVGGYASGLLGLGYKTPYLFKKASLYFELLGGAGAGGGVATEGGAIIQPMAGIAYDFSDAVGVQAGVGQIKAVNGSLNTTVVDAGLVFRFNTIEKR